MSKKGITAKKEENFSEWYTQVILKSEMMDYTSVSGCMVYRPLAYEIWQKVKREVDKRFKKIGIRNCYFPVFIPEHLLEKEAEHFKGFSPEVAWVTHAGDSELGERLAIRPTSETIMYETYSKWIRSWRDLPLRRNQWNNVVRWEFKDPTPFLRTREFLWCEGHNVYEDKEGALEDRDKVLKAFNEVNEEFLALPGIMGRKSQNEKFAGAVNSYSIEHMLPDGKVIQGPDYHYDGTNFAEAFDITFLDENEEERYAHQTTYAVSTRQLGIMVIMHSDNKGLVLPPKVAPIKTVIIPIRGEDNPEVLEKAEEIHERLEDSKLDDREEYTPGWKFNQWEMKGVPLRIEIGPNEVEEGKLTLVRRDNEERIEVEEGELEEKVEELLEDIQDNLFQKAKELLEGNIHETDSYKKMKKIIEEKRGLVKAPFCGNPECEERIKDASGIKVSNIPFRYDEPEGEECIGCDREATCYAHFAKSY